MKRTSSFVLGAGLAVLLAMSGCKLFGGSDSSSPAPAATTTTTSSGTPLTAAQMAGTHYAPCLAVTDNSYGSSVNGYSFLRSITLTSSNTYSISVMMYSGANCQAGGSQVFAYSQAGAFSIGSSLLSSGATGVMYTTASSNLTVYGGTSGGGTSGFGNGWVTSFNSGCPGGPTFTSGSASTFSVANLTCNTSGLGLPQFPANGTIFYDAVVLDSKTSPTVFKVYPAVSIFMLGQFSSFPANGTYSYTF